MKDKMKRKWITQFRKWKKNKNKNIIESCTIKRCEINAVNCPFETEKAYAIRSAGTVSHIYNTVAKEQSSNAIIAIINAIIEK